MVNPLFLWPFSIAFCMFTRYLEQWDVSMRLTGWRDLRHLPALRAKASHGLKSYRGLLEYGGNVEEIWRKYGGNMEEICRNKIMTNSTFELKLSATFCQATAWLDLRSVSETLNDVRDIEGTINMALILNLYRLSLVTQASAKLGHILRTVQLV